VFVCTFVCCINLHFTQSSSFVINSYGEERYEKKEMQQRVRERFSQLQAMDERDGKVPWYVVDAAQSVEEVQREINDIVETTVEKIQRADTPLGLLWQNTDSIADENKEN
jgi:dTMP kinase